MLIYTLLSYMYTIVNAYISIVLSTKKTVNLVMLWSYVSAWARKSYR